MDSETVKPVVGSNTTCLFQPTSPSSSAASEISALSANAAASSRWIASLRNSQQFSFGGKQPSQSAGSWAMDPLRRRSLSVGSFERNASRQDQRHLRQLAIESSNRIRSLAMREQTAAAERWHYIRSVLERRKERNRYLRQHFIRQPLESIIEARAKMPVICPSTPQKSILKNKVRRVEPTPVAPSVAIDSDLTKCTLWMEAASALMLADQWSKKRDSRVRFRPTEDVDDDDQADEPSVNAVKLPTLATAVQWPTESEKPQVGHQSGADRLPSLSDGHVGVVGCSDNDDEEADRRGGAVTSKGPSWAERQVAKVKQRKLWSVSSAAASSPLGRSLVGPRSEEDAVKIKGLGSRHSSGRLLRRTASMIVQMSDEGDNSSSSSSRSSQSPSLPAAEVETVPPSLLNDCSPSATDAGSMVGAHSPPPTRGLPAAETVVWEIPLEKQSIQRPERTSGPEQEAETQEANGEEEAARQYRGWPQFPELLAHNMILRLERIKLRMRTRLDKSPSRPKGQRMKRTPRWIKGKRPAARKRPDPLEEETNVQTNEETDGEPQVEPQVDPVEEVKEEPMKDDQEHVAEADKAVKEARNWHLQSEDQRRCDEASGGCEPPVQHATVCDDELLPWMVDAGGSNRPPSPVYQPDQDPKAVQPTLNVDGQDDCHCQCQCPCQYRSPCLHKAVLSCLLPESLNEALSNIETIRQQLKRTRLRRGRAKQ